MTSRIKCKECGAESMADGARLFCGKCYDDLFETLRLERRRFHRAAARWVDEMSILKEENIRLRQELIQLKKIDEEFEQELLSGLTYINEILKNFFMNVEDPERNLR